MQGQPVLLDATTCYPKTTTFCQKLSFDHNFYLKTTTFIGLTTTFFGGHTWKNRPTTTFWMPRPLSFSVCPPRGPAISIICQVMSDPRHTNACCTKPYVRGGAHSHCGAEKVRPKPERPRSFSGAPGPQGCEGAAPSRGGLPLRSPGEAPRPFRLGSHLFSATMLVSPPPHIRFVALERCDPSRRGLEASPGLLVLRVAKRPLAHICDSVREAPSKNS